MKCYFEKATIEDLECIEALVKEAVSKMRQSGNFQWGDEYPTKVYFIKDITNKTLYKAINTSGELMAIATFNDEQSEEYRSIRWGGNGPAFVLHRLIIHPNYQNQGLGKRFALYFEEQALTAGYDYLRLDAYSLNEVANRLYVGLEYEKRGEVFFRSLQAPFNCYEKWIGADAVINKRLAQQFLFIKEVDQMKSIYRQTMIMDKSRHENDAEHSWHLAIMAMLLLEHSNEKVDLLKVIKMVLLHDIVEIDAGDTFVYDEKGNADKYQREIKAANRIFGMLPEDQKNEWMLLWQEFESRNSVEAKYAASLDRIQPMLNNYETQGAAWKAHGIKKSQVLQKNRHIEEGSYRIWEYAQSMITDAVQKEFLINE